MRPQSRCYLSKSLWSNSVPTPSIHLCVVVHTLLCFLSSEASIQYDSLLKYNNFDNSELLYSSFVPEEDFFFFTKYSLFAVSDCTFSLFLFFQGVILLLFVNLHLLL